MITISEARVLPYNIYLYRKDYLPLNLDIPSADLMKEGIKFSC